MQRLFGSLLRSPGGETEQRQRQEVAIAVRGSEEHGDDSTAGAPGEEIRIAAVLEEGLPPAEGLLLCIDKNSNELSNEESLTELVLSKLRSYEQRAFSFEQRIEEYDRGFIDLYQKVPSFEERVATFEEQIAAFEQSLSELRALVATYEANMASVEQQMLRYEAHAVEMNDRETTYEQRLLLLQEGEVRLQLQQLELKSQQQEVAARAAALDESEADYEERARILGEKERDYARRIETLEKNEADYAERSTILVEKELDYANRKEILEKNEADYEERSRILVEKELDYANRIEILEKNEADYAERSEILVEKELDYAHRVKILEKNEADYDTRLSQLKAREATYYQLREELEKREGAHQDEVYNLQRREEQFAGEQKAHGARKSELATEKLDRMREMKKVQDLLMQNLGRNCREMLAVVEELSAEMVECGAIEDEQREALSAALLDIELALDGFITLLADLRLVLNCGRAMYARHLVELKAAFLLVQQAVGGVPSIRTVSVNEVIHAGLVLLSRADEEGRAVVSATTAEMLGWMGEEDEEEESIQHPSDPLL